MTKIPLIVFGLLRDATQGKRLEAELRTRDLDLLTSPEHITVLYDNMRMIETTGKGHWVFKTQVPGVGELTIVVDDQDAKTKLFAVAPDSMRENLVSAVRQHRRGTVGVLSRSIIWIGVALCVAYGTYLAIPRLAAVSGVTRIPASWDADLGGAALKQHKERIAVWNDAGARTALQRIAARFGTELGSLPYQFEYVPFNDPSENSQSLPGGKILINRGLIARCENAEELAGILAHQVAHVLERHAVRQLFSHLGFRLSLRILVSGTPDQDIAQYVPRVLSMKYEPDFEADAGRVAVGILSKVHIDPKGLETVTERLGRAVTLVPGSRPTFGAIHPNNAETLQAIRSAIQELPATEYEPLIENWAELRQAAQG